MDSKPEKRHKGTFVGGHLYQKQMEKLEEIARAISEATGEPPNQAAALRYIIDNFDWEQSRLGKELALAA
jgi:hypothetical protein